MLLVKWQTLYQNQVCAEELIVAGEKFVHEVIKQE